MSGKSRPISESVCPVCYRAEVPLRRRLADQALTAAAAILAPAPGPNLLGGLADVTAAMVGNARPRRTWYDKHRDAWVRTGDVAELARMLRHVT